jgi:hypothetical protein
MEKPCCAEKPRIKEINPETLGHSCFNMNRRKEKEYLEHVWRFQNNELTL